MPLQLYWFILLAVLMAASACGPQQNAAAADATPTTGAPATPPNSLPPFPSATASEPGISGAPTATPGGAVATAIPVPTATSVPERPAPTPAPSCFASPLPAVTGGETVTALAATAERAWALVYTPALTRTTVFYSDDAGATWTGGRFFNDFVSGITASPVYTRDRSVFAVGAASVYRSFNGGLSWGAITPTGWYTSTPIVRQFALSPSFGTDRLMLLGSPAMPRGIYASNDGGVSWRDWLVDAVDALFVSPNFAVDRAVWAARNDEQTFRRDVMVTTNQGESWEFVRSGSAFPRALSPAFSLDSTIFWGDLKGGLYLSRNSDRLSPAIAKADAEGLAIWQQAPGRGWDVVGDQAVHDIKFSADFARDRTAYAAAENAVLVTQNGGARWKTLCAWGGNAAQTDAARFNRLAVAPDDTLLAGGAGARLAVSRDGGQTWSLVSLK